VDYLSTLILNTKRETNEIRKFIAFAIVKQVAYCTVRLFHKLMTLFIIEPTAPTVISKSWSYITICLFTS